MQKRSRYPRLHVCSPWVSEDSCHRTWSRCGMNPTRRTVVQVLAVGSMGIAGCSDRSSTIEFRLVRANVSASKRERITPIRCANVTPEERELIQTAIESDQYTSGIGSAPPGLERLRERIRDHDSGGVELYLSCDERLYRVGFINGDHVLADPDR